jgi:hypothetical protein
MLRGSSKTAGDWVRLLKDPSPWFSREYTWGLFLHVAVLELSVEV